MKDKLLSSTFTMTTYFFVTILITGLTSFIASHAQSPVVGSWKEVSAKQFFTPEAAQKMGKGYAEYPMRPNHSLQWDLKEDHTYVILDGGGARQTKTTGVWSVKGNQLTMKSAAEIRVGMPGPHVYTFLINGNTMVRTMVNQPPYNETILKTEDTMTKINSN